METFTGNATYHIRKTLKVDVYHVTNFSQGKSYKVQEEHVVSTKDKIVKHYIIVDNMESISVS